MKKHRKHFFSLLEALIALVLAAVLISTVTFFYGQMNQVDSQITRDQQESFTKRLVENRLAATLQRAVKASNKEFVFLTTADAPQYVKPHNDSLIFTYHNNVDMEKALSNEVLGRLFVDNRDRLVLATWPPPSVWQENSGAPIEVKREVLMNNVDKIEWQFYIPPGKDQVVEGSTGSQTEPSPKNEWRSDWPPSFGQLPAIVKVTVTLKPDLFKNEKVGQKLEMAFPLPQTSQPIYYGN